MTSLNLVEATVLEEEMDEPFPLEVIVIPATPADARRWRKYVATALARRWLRA
jgi:hypothetical protein